MAAKKATKATDAGKTPIKAAMKGKKPIKAAMKAKKPIKVVILDRPDEYGHMKVVEAWEYARARARAGWAKPWQKIYKLPDDALMAL